MRQTKYLALGTIVAILLTLLVLPACASAPSPTPTPKPTPSPASSPTPTPTAAPKATPSPTPAASPTKSPLPTVPITYATDTNATVIRRAQWMEAARKEGTLVWYSTGTAAESAKVIAEFNKVYPFIKVEPWNATAEEMASKIEAEFLANKVSDDVNNLQLNFVARWRQRGMLDKFTDNIPGIEKWGKGAYSAYGDWAYPGNIVHTPGYNTKLVTAAEAPKGWEDLLDPKWKGQIGMVTDVSDWTILAVAEGGWGADKTSQFLTKLATQKPIWGQGRSAVHNLMVSGEFKINADDSLRYFITGKEKGEPSEWVRSNPAVIGGPIVLLMKNAPHPNASRLFLEWLFSPPGLAAYETISGAGVVYPGAPTRQAKLLEGMSLVYLTEDGVAKADQLGLFPSFTKILGITQ